MKNYDEMANDVLRRIDEQNSLLEEKRENRRKTMKKVAASLGCVCLLAIVGAVAWQTGLVNFNKGVYIPRAEIAVNTDMSQTQNIPKMNPEKASESKHYYDSNESSDGKKYKEQATGEEILDYIEYIEYEGRIYHTYWGLGPSIRAPIEKPDLSGCEYLGKVNDEVSGITGNISGKVYLVKDVDKSFILYVDFDYAKEWAMCPYFVHDNDITLRTGADWYGKLNVKGNISSITYVCWDENVTNCYGPTRIDKQFMPKMNEFIEALYESPFVSSEEAKIDQLKETSPVVGVNITLNNGKELSFELLDAGYVLIHANVPVCIKMDDQVFFDVFSMLQ